MVDLFERLQEGLQEQRLRRPGSGSDTRNAREEISRKRKWCARREKSDTSGPNRGCGCLEVATRMGALIDGASSYSFPVPVDAVATSQERVQPVKQPCRKRNTTVQWMAPSLPVKSVIG